MRRRSIFHRGDEVHTRMNSSCLPALWVRPIDVLSETWRFNCCSRTKKQQGKGKDERRSR